MQYPLIDVIRQRYSVRTFSNEPISPETMDKIQAYIDTLENPFGVDVKIGMVKKSLAKSGEKLSTYGMIKGADTFLGVWVPDVPDNMLAAGYEFEDLILYLTSLGIGTVWIAGTLTREKFAKALGVADSGETFVAISPIGYAAEKKRLFEKITRKAIGADKRKPWSNLFFEGDFSLPLSPERAGRYADALEMLRLAPSATNAQPWRVVKEVDMFHFYVAHKPDAKDAPIKRVDLGIALFHFISTLETTGITGRLVNAPQNTPANLPSDHHYVISWQATPPSKQLSGS